MTELLFFCLLFHNYLESIIDNLSRQTEKAEQGTKYQELQYTTIWWKEKKSVFVTI